MDKLKLMKTFMLTVEEGSISKAARHLKITKAAASNQIINLESSLNVRLLHRTTRALTLTDAGDLYYKSLKKIFFAVNEAESSVTDMRSNPVGILRVTSHRYFGEKYILSNLKKFTMDYPDLKLDIEFADRFPDMEKENIDILCGIGHEGPDHLVRKRIASTHHILCASPDYLKQHGVPKKLADLRHHKYIHHSFRDPNNNLTFKNGKEIYLDFCIRVNDAQSMLQCALQGIGIIKIYDYFIKEYIQDNKLVELLKNYRDPQKSIYVFYQQQKFVQPKIRLFLDFVYRNIATIGK
jgi:DNA-binding transcriptional LysR family regulator